MATIQNEINKTDVSQFSVTMTDVINDSLTNLPFVNSLKAFIERTILESNFSSPKSKLELIRFLGKMNRYQEALELKRGNIDVDALKKAAGSFGAKAQSGFSTGTAE